jgi:hypothetical protein
VTDAERQAFLEAQATKPAAVTTDAGSVTQRSADDLLKLTAAAADLTGTNENGGPKSPFRRFRAARASFPGAYR